MTVVVRAAGVIYLASDNRALFLQRATGDHQGEWCLPGGVIERDESPEEAAKREFREETGKRLDGTLQEWTRRIRADPAAGPPPAFGSATVAGAIGSPALVPSATPIEPQVVDFTTFVYPGVETFEPVLNEEHCAYAWAPLQSPPHPLHPGCYVALSKFGADELWVAEMIRDGQLSSPQKYENVWLFDVRVTGTGNAYRSKINEHVYRPPDDYLSDRFLQRCNGLPVVWEHPPKATLDSKQYAKRNIGSILLPYIKGDEVWGIAKIYDDGAAQLMTKEQLSTSPGVAWRDPKSTNMKMALEDGSTFLIEGKPSLLDHLAVCELGVWDKGGDPAGVRTETIGDSQMATPEELKAAEDKKRKDAEEIAARAKADDDARRKDDDDARKRTDEKLDKLLTHVDSIGKRMDSMEETVAADKKRKDAEEGKKKEEEEKAAADKKKKDDDDKARRDAMTPEERAAEDKAKKDAEEEESKKKKEEEEAKAADKKKKDDDDDAKKRHDSAAINKRFDELAAKIPMSPSDADFEAMTSIQARADDVFHAFGERASRPQNGETPLSYRRRMASALKKHHPDWKDIDLVRMDEAAFSLAEKQIYDAAARAANNPVDVPAGQLRQITRVDKDTRVVTHTFVGPQSFIAALKPPGQRVTRIKAIAQD